MSFRPRVLVADDDADLRSLVAEALGAEGYDVRVAANGVDALRLLERETVDAIVLDLMMPVLDGWRVVRSYRNRLGGGAGILCVSATMNQHLTHRLQALGVGSCLAKPFDVDELLQCVRALL